jgi:hypothetical protein
MALSGPQHYAKADELLAEIEVTPAMVNPPVISDSSRSVTTPSMPHDPPMPRITGCWPVRRRGRTASGLATAHPTEAG